MEPLTQFLSERSFVAYTAFLSALSMAVMSHVLTPERTR
jgi:hypothetical protein